MDAKERKTALRAIENGIYLVGCRDGESSNVFMGSWLSQMSFDPPLVVMGLKKDTEHHSFIKKSGGFVVNILGRDQQDVASRFFKHQNVVGDTVADEKVSPSGRFGAPILESVPAWFEAEVRDWVEGGDHDIVVATVIDAGARVDGDFDALTEDSTKWNYGG